MKGGRKSRILIFRDFEVRKFATPSHGDEDELRPRLDLFLFLFLFVMKKLEFFLLFCL